MDRETADEIKRHVTDGLRDLWTEIQDVRTELRTEIQEGRRHSDVVAESLRSEIRLVAEGVTRLDEKFTVEFKKVREEIGEVNGFLRLSYADLDRRKMDKPS